MWSMTARKETATSILSELVSVRLTSGMTDKRLACFIAALC
jgi:hypothetical protein